MDKVWEIIEHRRGESSDPSKSPASGYRMGRRSAGMSGRREDSEEYKKGMKEGFCLALDMLDEFIDSYQEK